MSFSTPIGFLIFNRPDLTEQVFAAIAQIKPKQLFVVADGPRFPEEEEKCEQTRAIIQKIDWDCKVSTNFSDVNLGCGKRVASGVSWVFSRVEEAIFLEDDTLPTPSFFTFCQTLLEHYRDDKRIMHINGDNSANQQCSQHSYYFSKYTHIWGWASWRRAWQHYDYSMKSWSEFKAAKLLDFICEDPYERKYWTKIFDQMSANPPVTDTWDYQWQYACWSQSGLVIAPNENLISNLGFNRFDATHTTGDSPRSNLPTRDIWELNHPLFIVRNQVADARSFDYLCGGLEMKEQDKLPAKFRRSLSIVKQSLKKQLKN